MLGMPTEPVNTPKFYDRVVRYDTERQAVVDCYTSQPGNFLAAEPQFLAAPEPEQGGILICQSFDATSKYSDYIFLDAFNLERGIIAGIKLPFFDPPAFHTSFQRT